MKVLKGRGITRGKASGEALVTRAPINFTAAHTKLKNALRLSENLDPHHDLFGERIDGKVLVFPTCVGSTYTGVILLELMYRNAAPVAVVVQEADPLLVSGAVLGEIWFDRKLPVVEYRGTGLYESLRSRDRVSVDADTGEITVN